MDNKNVCILGSTGSIGTQAIDVCISKNIKVTGLAAYKNIKLLEHQARKLDVKSVCIFDENYYKELKENLSDTGIKVYTKMEGLVSLSCLKETDILLNSVVGMIGLTPTLEAIKLKKDIALANKETLVTGGKIVTGLAKKHGVKILPVDSEHSAIFQALNGEDHKKIKRIILTASGGPFFGKTKADLELVTKKEALKHPNWDMGAKITIDSSTLMNKGLEYIEAAHLFDVGKNQLDIVVHKESIVHSMVEFVDNSIIAQLGFPSMKLPIQYALTYPNREMLEDTPLDLFSKDLTFRKPDYETFSLLDCCIKAHCDENEFSATVVNGANEKAVELFLADRIRYCEIAESVIKVYNTLKPDYEYTTENIIKVDKQAREAILSLVE